MTKKTLKKHKSVRDALKHVDENPYWPAGDRHELPAWEWVARRLYQHANSADEQVSGSFGRALRAQKMLLNRMTGTRRTGTHPAVQRTTALKIKDLTMGLGDKVDDDE